MEFRIHCAALALARGQWLQASQCPRYYLVHPVGNRAHNGLITEMLMEPVKVGLPVNPIIRNRLRRQWWETDALWVASEGPSANVCHFSSCPVVTDRTPITHVPWQISTAMGSLSSPSVFFFLPISTLLHLSLLLSLPAWPCLWFQRQWKLLGQT